MQVCPFCRTHLTDSTTFCKTCGYPLILALPYLKLARRKIYLVFSISSVFLGIISCAFTLIPALHIVSLPFVIGAMGTGGVSLERTRGIYGTLAIKLLAVAGLSLGVLGYVSFMFMRSNVPGGGYSM